MLVVRQMFFVLAWNRTHYFYDSSRAFSSQYLVLRTRRAIDCHSCSCWVLGTGYWVLGLLARHDADVGQIPIAFRVVQSVAHNELIGNGEADVVALQWQLTPRRLVQ